MNTCSAFLSNVCTGERRITTDEACAIRLLLFGSTVKSFDTGWKQGFEFRSHPSYKMIQKRSGPCGVLAAVQAYVVLELLFVNDLIVPDSDLLDPKAAQRQEALARALAGSLWQAGEHKAVFLARKCNEMCLDELVTSSFIEVDGILEYIRLKHFCVYDDLVEYIYNFIQDFIEDGGIILFLYSIILTHGIDNIMNEMDYPDSHLIGNDGFCAQEVVNLILIGKAVANVFDGDIELNFDGEIQVHRGIFRRSKIGFLSIYEDAHVGSFYRDPVYPIWLIFGISHFSVLFGTSKNIFEDPTKSFKLIYSDCLAKMNEDPCYIVNPTAREEPLKKDKNLSVVMQCIYTRWPLADVELEKFINKTKMHIK